MPNSQDDDLLALQIKAHMIIADPKPAGPQFQLFKRFGVGKWMLLESLQRFSDSRVGVGY
ncbi:MAG: hypothetical protein OEY77_11205 [Nitrospira sp.]|nr:hypothetical protein [Nitrospira sp.]